MDVQYTAIAYGAIHILRYAPEGGEGVSKNITFYNMGEGGSPARNNVMIILHHKTTLFGKIFFTNMLKSRIFIFLVIFVSNKKEQNITAS